MRIVVSAVALVLGVCNLAGCIFRYVQGSLDTLFPIGLGTVTVVLLGLWFAENIKRFREGS